MVYSLIPEGDVGVARKNYAADAAAYNGDAAKYPVGFCDASKEEQINKHYLDAGPSLKYVRTGPNSNTYVRYQLTKAKCIPPSIANAPGY